jgi:biotin carboxyl carrier protein
MNRYQVTVNSKEYDVLLHKKVNSHLTFEIDGEMYEVDVTPKLGRPAELPAGTIPAPARLPVAARGSDDRVVAPMPGIVVSINVSPGDAVHRGTILCVMEAMKMENNIPSPRDGVVKEVLIKPGQEVDNSQVLVTFE